MRSELELAYIGIEAPEPDSLTTLLADVVGLVPGDPLEGDTRTWRNDDRAHRVIVAPGPADDATFLGLEAVDEAAFEAVAGRLRAAGHPLQEGTGDELAARRVCRLVRTAAPWGVAVELVLGLEPAADPGSWPLVPGGFVTEAVGFGHAVFATADLEGSHAFLVEALGFAQSDWLQAELAPGFEVEVHFYHCNRRHHTVALAGVPFDPPQKLHHIMFETRERDAVGTAFDRAWAGGLTIANGLGRHDNDGMFSFYVASPAGWQVEVGHGARTITDGWDDDRRYDRISAWGHQPLRQG